MTGEPGIENGILDVSAHLLSTEHYQLYLFVINAREITAGRLRDIKSRPAEKIKRGFLQTPLRDTKFQNFL
jgi:hypothetical protein